MGLSVPEPPNPAHPHPLTGRGCHAARWRSRSKRVLPRQRDVAVAGHRGLVPAVALGVAGAVLPGSPERVLAVYGDAGEGQVSALRHEVCRAAARGRMKCGGGTGYRVRRGRGSQRGAAIPEVSAVWGRQGAPRASGGRASHPLHHHHATGGMGWHRHSICTAHTAHSTHTALLLPLGAFSFTAQAQHASTSQHPHIALTALLVDVDVLVHQHGVAVVAVAGLVVRNVSSRRCSCWWPTRSRSCSPRPAT